MNIIFKSLSIAILSSIAAASCMKDPFEKIKNLNGVRWKGDYAAALINAELNLEDAVALVDNTSINAFGDKTLSVNYDQKHYS
jgi:hypothetical protein